MPTSKIIIEVTKNKNENNINIVRRFSRKMKESGTLRKVRSIRYKQRTPSALTLKQSALRRIGKAKEREVLRKLGKIK
ncbi:hypothetical protein COB64_01775 [Candidatus Wolfebacteria bacterium]|nr:MAG: hypothetical protein COB64_01775 [Candidatus Wolfebacteria bacterium]